jgi:hypothetical protein
MIWYGMIWYDTIYDMIRYMIWNDIWYDMTWHDMTWYDMIWYDIWYDMIWYDMIWYDMIWYDLIYLLTAVGLSPGGSSTVHIYTETVHRTTQITTNVEQCGPCPVFASFTLAFALQLKKKHCKTSVRIRKTSVRLRKTSVRVQYTYYQNWPSHVLVFCLPLIEIRPHTNLCGT